MSYALHKVYEFVESITREGNFVEFWQSREGNFVEFWQYSKEASRNKDHARPGIGTLEPRVYELCPPQGIRDCREHDS